MSKAIKLQDDTFIDSTGIVHNKVLLSEILETLNADDLTKVIGGISTDINRADLNDFTDKLIAGYGHNLVNSPLEDTPQGHLLSIPRHDAEGYVTQLFSPYPKGDLYIRQCVEGTWGAWTLVNPYKVGDIVITGANANPGDRYGGTWELVDKEFIPYRGAKNEGITNTSNATSPTCYFIRNGHSITFQFGLTTNAQIADTTLQLLTVSLATIGVNGLYCDHSFILWGDEAQSVAFSKLTYDGKVNTYDQLPDSYIAKSRYLEGTVTVNVSPGNMLDSACGKFYWKRIS